MHTPWAFIVAGESAIALAIIAAALSLRFRFHRKIIITLCAMLFIAGAATVLRCPLCVDCGGKTSQGSPWSGICCVQSWRSAKNILWWDLITEPGEWK
ncbi:MAG: hypothetical protein WCV62_00405 [Candidatus Peribacteraceae bacterium]